MEHECIKKFNKRKIDDCSDQGFNKCFGTSEMWLEIWFEDKDGTETFFDNWTLTQVNFCPFCGLKSQPERLNEKTSR